MPNPQGQPEPTVVIQAASPLDVPLLMHWVEAGSYRRLFNAKYIGFAAQIDLWRRATRASRLLTRRLDWHPGTRSLFVRARVDDDTVGLLLLNLRSANRAVIEFVCVDELWQGRGIARQLLRAVMDLLPYHCSLDLSCSPYAKDMLALLVRMGFAVQRSPRAVMDNRISPWQFSYRKVGAFVPTNDDGEAPATLSGDTNYGASGFDTEFGK